MTYFVCSKVSQFEVEVSIENAVFWFYVSVKHASFVEVGHRQQGLGEVMLGQWLRKTTHSDNKR